jgi:hypothetical protein
MGLGERIQHLDRRFIFLTILVVILFPYVKPIGLPIRVSKEAAAFHAAIERVPEGTTVFLAADYDPASLPELYPMTLTAIEQCFRRNLKIVGFCLWPGGPPLLNRALAEVAARHGKEYGVDYVNLGFKDGQEAVMVMVGSSIREAFPADFNGTPIASLPIMQGVLNFSSVHILINISAGYPGTKEWVQQVGSRFRNAEGLNIPIVSGCTAVSAPEYYAYVNAGQLEGLLGGLAGAAEYEKQVGIMGTATRGMDCQSLAHLAIIAFILLGNILGRGAGRKHAA